MKYAVLLLGLMAFAMPEKIKMTIRGTYLIAPKPGEKIYLAVSSDPKSKVKTKLDSTTVKGRKFSFQLNKLQPGKYELLNSAGQFISLYLDRGETRVVIDSSFMRSKVQGNMTDSLIKRYESLGTNLALIQFGYVMMVQKYEKEGTQMPDSMQKALTDQMVMLMEAQKKAAVEIGSRKDLAAAYVLTKGAAKEFTLPELNNFYQSMAPYVQEAPFGVAFKGLLDKMNSVGEGVKAPDFTQQDTDGKEVKLSEFVKGKKLVMIDFWASWCGPCRKENPHVVELYKKYKSKGFDIIGVSLDSKKPDWLEAIRADGLTWTHVSDLGGWQNSVAKQYNVDAVPLTILLDGNGVIVAKNLRGAKLEEKVAELCK